MSEPSRLILVRHGTCARLDELLLGRTIDAPLDENGRAQARAVAEHLADVMNPVLECSPRLRARETAEEIGRRLNVTPQIAAALDELDFGHWSGQRFSELEKDAQWHDWNRKRSQAFTPSGESIASVHRRVSEHLQQLLDQHPHATLILVTHAEIIRTLLLSWLNLSADAFSQVPIGPASLTKVEFDSAGARMRELDRQVSP
jgi:broad specificity phosphatase PhoE